MRSYLQLSLAGLLMVGCLEEFQSPTVLDSLRVLGVRLEPPEIRPGEAARVSALIFAPEGRTVERRWAACLLEAPFIRGNSAFGGGGGGRGGGGGGGSAERIPSEQAEPIHSCFDTEAAVPLGEGDEASLFFPPLPPELLDVAQPDVDLPEEVSEFASLPDLNNLGVLAGFYFTVSLEVSDGVDTLITNKRLVVKLAPHPLREAVDLSVALDASWGAQTKSWWEKAGGRISDDEAEEDSGPSRVYYAFDGENFFLAAPFARGRFPAQSSGYRLDVYVPQQRWNLEATRVERNPHNATTRFGADAAPLAIGVATEVSFRWQDDGVRAVVSRADGEGGWVEAEEHSVQLGAPGEDAQALTAMIPLADLRLESDSPLSFMLAAVDGGETADLVPNVGRRFVYGGPPNENPAAPGVALWHDEAGERLEGLVARPGAELELRAAPESEAAREPFPFISFRGELVDRREVLFYTWYSNLGTLQRYKTQGYEEHHAYQQWTAPLTPAAGEHSLYLLVQDGRGGAAWSRLPITVERN